MKDEGWQSTIRSERGRDWLNELWMVEMVVSSCCSSEWLMWFRVAVVVKKWLNVAVSGCKWL